MSRLNVGDRVGYRVRWLRSVGLAHSDASHARGVVTALDPFGGDRILATVEWDDSSMPPRVLADNLAKPGTMAFTSEDR